MVKTIYNCVISIVKPVPAIGKCSWPQWRKLNAYNTSIYKVTQSKSRWNNKSVHSKFNCITVNFEKTPMVFIYLNEWMNEWIHLYKSTLFHYTLHLFKAPFQSWTTSFIQLNIPWYIRCLFKIMPNLWRTSKEPKNWPKLLLRITEQNY